MLVLPFADMARYNRAVADYRNEGYPTNGAELQEWYDARRPEGKNSTEIFVSVIERMNEQLGAVYTLHYETLKENPDQEDNGVPIDYLPLSGSRSDGLPNPEEPIPQTMMDALEYLEKSFGRSLEELVRHRNDVVYYSFEIDPEHPENLELPMLARARMAARFLSECAIFRAEKGDLDGALDCIETALWVGEVQNGTPATVGYLVSSAIHGIELKAVRYLMHRYRFNERQLNRIREMFKNQESHIDVSAGYVGDFVNILNGYLTLFKERTSSDKSTAPQFGSTYSPAVDATFADEMRFWLKQYVEDEWHLSDRLQPWNDRAYLISKKRFRDQELLLEHRILMLENWDATHFLALPDEIRTTSKGSLLEEHAKQAVDLVTSTNRIMQAIYRHRAVLRIAQIEALVFEYQRETNDWPEALEDVESELGITLPLDPYTNAPFFYEKDIDEANNIRWEIGTALSRQEVFGTMDYQQRIANYLIYQYDFKN